MVISFWRFFFLCLSCFGWRNIVHEPDALQNELFLSTQNYLTFGVLRLLKCQVLKVHLSFCGVDGKKTCNWRNKWEFRPNTGLLAQQSSAQDLLKFDLESLCPEDTRMILFIFQVQLFTQLVPVAKKKNFQKEEGVQKNRITGQKSFTMVSLPQHLGKFLRLWPETLWNQDPLCQNETGSAPVGHECPTPKKKAPCTKGTRTCSGWLQTLVSSAAHVQITPEVTCTNYTNRMYLFLIYPMSWKLFLSLMTLWARTSRIVLRLIPESTRVNDWMCGWMQFWWGGVKTQTCVVVFTQHGTTQI